MKTFPIALQLYSVREEMSADLAGTLKKVKAMGYDGVEFAGLFDHSVQEVRALLDEIGLQAISAHAQMNPADAEQVIGDYAALGCRYIVIPGMGGEYRPGAAKFGETVENAKRYGRLAKEKGLIALYHNHDSEFIKVDGEYALDILYRSVPADLLQTQIDTCWANVGGADPVAYIEKYSGRAPVVHLKDFVKPGWKPARADALVGEEPDAFEMRPIGYGVQDIPGILAASEKAGTEWLVVEQDTPTKGMTSMECAEKSLQYLKNLEL